MGVSTDSFFFLSAYRLPLSFRWASVPTAFYFCQRIAFLCPFDGRQYRQPSGLKPHTFALWYTSQGAINNSFQTQGVKKSVLFYTHVHSSFHSFK